MDKTEIREAIGKLSLQDQNEIAEWLTTHLIYRYEKLRKQLPPIPLDLSCSIDFCPDYKDGKCTATPTFDCPDG